MTISALWKDAFIQKVSKVVRDDGVLFLGGIFDCPPKQAAALGRSCGAVPPSPFAQIFKETIDERPNYVFSLAFIFVIGNAKCRKPHIDSQPEMPSWLHTEGRSMNSLMVRSTRALSEMPQWEQDEDSGQTDIMFLGDVKQKVAKIKWWRPRIHQLFLHVGARQQSAPRVVRSCRCLEPGCSQLRIPMSIDDGPKKATHCPQERRGGS